MLNWYCSSAFIEQTEGNPFFMEETMQALLDAGALKRNGVMRLTRPIPKGRFSPTHSSEINGHNGDYQACGAARR